MSYTERARENTLAMSDVSKAFDSVRQGTIVRAFTRLGAPRKDVSTILALLADQDATTEIRKDMFIQLKPGVRQGDPLSPLLTNLRVFNAVIGRGDIPRSWRSRMADDSEGQSSHNLRGSQKAFEKQV